ncbi:polyprenol monophosphomannose synthase [Candidatus Giovannonibacteria bacterium]|nr:polyprenol monophosphomannose synthase [Candidatus Giovannonibacteria bacterium]
MAEARIIVLTPTYNESENIENLIKRVFGLSIPNLKMIVVDDNSPDGTAEIVRKYIEIYPIELICREKKQGLGPAYVEGFKKALSDRPAFIIQMDADLSHDPGLIPDLLVKIKTHDVVLGSRYIEGGKIENWDRFRMLVSSLGNLYARTVLDVPIRDLTSGYKCWRPEALRKINLESLSSLGYNFQIETIYRAYMNKSKICEIPIVFRERKLGRSKFNLPIMVESFFKVLVLRLREK